MKICHTSDWHLGRLLYGRRRYDEFEAFLTWFTRWIEKESVNLLLISGDVFDTTTPSNRAQELYYHFLCRVASSHCRHVVVTAGNHDSPSFLSAPKTLLKALDVHVIGAATEHPEDEVLLLKSPSGDPEIIVCAVPYLRDRDIRTVEAGEHFEEKHLKVIQGIQEHYRQVVNLAIDLRKEYGEAIPIIAMGHLFTAGGKTLQDDGVRELYVGNLAYVGKETFPPEIDYLALGHLHVAQSVGGCEHMRYAGAPLPMGFGEVGQGKKIVLIETASESEKENLLSASTAPTHEKENASIVPHHDGTDGINSGMDDEMGNGVRFEKSDLPVLQSRIKTIREIPLPVFQELERIKGSLDEITNRIEALKSSQSRAWLEIEYTGQSVAGTLRQQLDSLIEGSGLEILKIKNRRMMQRFQKPVDTEAPLDDLSQTDVFLRCLEYHQVPPTDHAGLLHCYRELLVTLHENELE